jgi:hypothetical protein
MSGDASGQFEHAFDTTIGAPVRVVARSNRHHLAGILQDVSQTQRFGIQPGREIPCWRSLR